MDLAPGSLLSKHYVVFDISDEACKNAETQDSCLAVRMMIDLINNDKQAIFQLSTPRYYLEGEVYNTSAITLSQEHTVNLKQTIDEFGFETFFMPDQVHPEAREGKPVRNGVIQVKMEIKLEDIMFIVGKTSGSKTQRVLYCRSTKKHTH